MTLQEMRCLLGHLHPQTASLHLLCWTGAPSTAFAALQDCHAEPHADYDGPALSWGITFKRSSAAQCCQECKQVGAFAWGLGLGGACTCRRHSA